MRKAFLFSVIFGLGLGVKAQYLSNGKKFEVDEIRGCAPFTFKITQTNLDGSHACTSGPGGTPCSMIFNGSASCPAPTGCSMAFTFTANTPGIYKLQVIYQGGGADAIDYIDVTVDPNIQPEFDIYSCAGEKVQVNITDRNYDKYNIDFNGDNVFDQTISSGIKQTATYSYGAVPVGTRYNIQVQGQKTNGDNNCDLKRKAFDVVAALPVPTINTLTAKSIDSLVLGFTAVANIDYKSEIATNSNTSFIGYPVQYGANSLTIPNVNVDNNYYCLRLNSFDPCANINKYSPIPVCSHKFSINPINGVNQLAWQTSSLGVSEIDIKRNSTAYDIVAGTAVNYDDDSISCNNYSYQLINKYSSAISTSLTKHVKGIKTTTPTAINNTSAVVGEPQVDLVWLEKPAFTLKSYDILRGPNGGPYNHIGSSKSPVFTDQAYNNAGYCYQINYTDKCGNASDNGLPVCPIVLSATLNEYNDVILDWSAYQGWNLGVKNYKILRYYQPGQTPQSLSPLPGSLTYTDNANPANQVIYYKIDAVPNEAGVSPSISNELKVVRNINLYYPTAFNPESHYSPLNKTFSVKGHFIVSMKLQIFDRWGALVFYSDENEAWDGKKEGQPMPDATYVWTADGTDLAGNSFKRAGTVILIRKK